MKYAIKILVCGSRNFANYELMDTILFPYECEAKDQDILPEECCIVSGGAFGADSLAEKWAKENYWQTEIYKPDWEKNGKSAGFIRNQEMIDANPNLVVAFWDGQSKGTKHTIDLARKAKIPTLIAYF